MSWFILRNGFFSTRAGGDACGPSTPIACRARRSDSRRVLIWHGTWAVCIVYLIPSVLLFSVVTSTTSSAVVQESSAEAAAFEAVKTATNAASSISAAEFFVSRFPHSSKRVLAARFVAEQLKTIRNAEIGITLVERARAIFTAPDELNFLQPVAFATYAKANRIDEAVAVASDLLSRKPYEFSILLQLMYLGAEEARNKKLSHVDLSLQYGARAIEIIEENKRPTDLSDEEWIEQKAALPALYQQMGILRLAQGKTSEATVNIRRATQLEPRNPTGFALLARILDEEYEKLRSAYDAMAEGPAKQETKDKLDVCLDELIETYARAAGLATGRREYLVLLQQVIPDLTKHYKLRHNDTAGLQQLIEKYKSK